MENKYICFLQKENFDFEYSEGFFEAKVLDSNYPKEHGLLFIGFDYNISCEVLENRQAKLTSFFINKQNLPNLNSAKDIIYTIEIIPNEGDNFYYTSFSPPHEEEKINKFKIKKFCHLLPNSDKYKKIQSILNMDKSNE